MTPTLSLRAVLAEAEQSGVLSTDAGPLARTALTEAARDDMPWYLRVLVGGAAWVGALFLLGTVLGIISLAIGERVDAVAMVMGLVLMPAGVLLRRKGGGELLRQVALVCVITGQLLLIGGLGAISEAMTLTAVAGIVSSVALIATFDDGVYRFGATLAIIGAVLVVAFDVRLPYSLGLVTAVTACVPVLVWRTFPELRRLHAPLDPVAWACATGTCALLTVQATLDAVTGTSGYSPDFIQLLLPRAWPLTLVFVALLVWLALQVVRDHGSTPSAPVPLAALVATVALGALTASTPAVSGALLFVVLGFDRRRTGLVALGAAFLIAFLGLYYYSLSLSLLQKSFVLVASGAVCVGVSAFLRRQLPEVPA